jgi:hypothetical protein
VDPEDREPAIEPQVKPFGSWDDCPVAVHYWKTHPLVVGTIYEAFIVQHLPHGILYCFADQEAVKARMWRMMRAAREVASGEEGG